MVDKVPITVLAATFSLTSILLNSKPVGALLESVIVKVALGLAFNSTETVSSPAFATAKSDLPSPLKSPTVTELGLDPTPMGVAASKPVLSALRSSTETLLLPLFATAKSDLPSPLKSPTVTELGLDPTPMLLASKPVLSALRSSTETLLSL
ncbi:hypothetical protein NIES4074_57580 [Cylindrospermum sp. NIES-4074]|nr:hypothetical protein NIES4074_57580 [Cylindrospermum sp. NIES-4074]